MPAKSAPAGGGELLCQQDVGVRALGVGASDYLMKGRGSGDLVARVLVETPRRMSAKQKKLLEEFKATETGDECPASKSFFQRIRETFGS